jgi:hypothetical protein
MWSEFNPDNHGLDAAMVALLAWNRRSREPSILGTGFVIGAWGQYALVACARHCLEYAVRVQTPYSSHHASSPRDFVFGPRLSIDASHLRVIYASRNAVDVCRVIYASAVDQLDVAVIIIQSQDGNDITFETRVDIDTSLPTPEADILLLSFADLGVSEWSISEDKVEKIILRRRVSALWGKIVSVYPHGLRHYRFPCFTTTAPVTAGMSGGICAYFEPGLPLIACGMIAADASDHNARRNKLTAGESIISALWPIVGLPMPMQINDNFGRCCTIERILDLIRPGFIHDRGRADLVTSIEVEAGDRAVVRRGTVSAVECWPPRVQFLEVPWDRSCVKPPV